ncbi:hypothetical protein EB796_002347 [Bugula neritina]|uniref:Uncharacterized protein n=1 Tax=Bugula neritina TaxID=10212 RepID=A0A7J7KMH4_BUGNE|nr:hypothetical protein EB796_002347 [Bugula neritina]
MCKYFDIFISFQLIRVWVKNTIAYLLQHSYNLKFKAESYFAHSTYNNLSYTQQIGITLVIQYIESSEDALAYY